MRIDGWRRPLFVGGESFGVWRAAGVVEALERRGARVAGEILISGGIPVIARPPYAVKAALFLPTRATAALYHHRLAPELQADPAATIDAAAKWAREEYAPALEGAETLPHDRRMAVVAQLARFSGLRAAEIDSVTLIVKRSQFAQSLLRDQHLALDRFDTRRTHPTGSELGRTLVDIRRDALTVQYLRLEVGYRTDVAYLGSEQGYEPVTEREPSGPASQWGYDQNPPDTTQPPASTSAQARRLADDGPPNGAEPWLRRAMEIDGGLRAFVAVGMYDSLNSCSWNDYLVSTLEPAIGSRITAKCYTGGHMMYEDPGTRFQVARDIAAFITSAAAATR